MRGTQDQPRRDRRAAPAPRVAIHAATLAVALAGATAPARAGGEVLLAFAGLGFSDSSGEAEDQRKVHAERLSRFKADLEAGLAKSGKYRLAALSCPSETCGASDQEAADLDAQAKKAGADLLLIGGVHKMSSLVLWLKVDVIDIATGKRVLERLLTFRGDNDAAWNHAAEFLLRQLGEMER
jgi:Protein of unknown function (DUF2380)